MNQRNKVVLGLLHELALGADAVEHLREHGTQKLLGAMPGRPPLTSASYMPEYMPEKSASIFTWAALTICRMGRRGWSAGTKSSSLRTVKVPDPRMKGGSGRAALDGQ
jgi:hypothetical protein